MKYGDLDLWTRMRATMMALSDPRKAARFVNERMQFLAYKAADRKGANARWLPGNRSEDAELRRDGRLVTARARDLVHSSPHVFGAIERIAANVVFCGIRAQAEAKRADGSLDTEINRRVESQWKRWAEHPHVRFYELQELAVRHCWTDGGLLAHYYVDTDLLRDGVVPLGIELIEMDQIDTSVHGPLPGGTVARRGIEYNAKGHPVAYHLHTEHPGDAEVLSFSSFGSVRIPVENLNHIFLRRRISQSTGASWLASVVPDMRDLNEYRDSERIAARLVSAFGFFVSSPTPEAQPEDFMSTWPEDTVEPGDFIEPGRVQFLPDGAEIKGTGFDRPGNTYEPFVRDTLRGASVGMGMSYEAASNDYTGASYSSARSASLEERRGYRKQQHFINRRFNTPTWNWWISLLSMSGLEPDAPANVPVRWQNPGWPWVDPLKDSKSAELELKLGITSMTRIAADRGHDLEEILEERKRERELLEKYGLTAKEEPHAPEA
ncbi:phage portal protein [Desulfovibrio oxyclinae]|uniref:phage portal protein n=1 Tax=Desulfovibrio oxyclinae TaxID=63560 RepID=UPI0003727C07|nr:phage portal protein [Desulfovibrio oxyclinae]